MPAAALCSMGFCSLLLPLGSWRGPAQRDASHAWPGRIDRLLAWPVCYRYGPVWPPGAVPRITGGALERIGRWIHLLTRSLAAVPHERNTARSQRRLGERLPPPLRPSSAIGGERGWELQLIREAIR